MWLGQRPYDLLTSYATGFVGQIGDGYRYNKGSCVQSMQITSNTLLPSDCRQPWKESVVTTGVGSTTLNKALALVAGVFITALPAFVFMVGHPSIHHTYLTHRDIMFYAPVFKKAMYVVTYILFACFLYKKYVHSILTHSISAVDPDQN